MGGREVYGKGESERILGRLRKEASPEVREKLFIATKCTYRTEYLTTIVTRLMRSVDLGMPGAGHFFLFRPAIDTAVKLSLERLGVDSIDLYMASSVLF